MQNQPLISVIVPVYNVEEFLSKCINSILSQTYTNIEVLLIDDGSPDNSGKICDEYASKDSRVRVFHKQNGGVSSARNLGLKEAKGDFICFIDSDDFVKESFLEDFGIEKNIDWYICGFIETSINNEEKNLPHKEGCFYVKDEAFVNQLLDDFIFRLPYCKLYRRKIVIENHIFFDQNFNVSEDTLFNVSYISHCSQIKLIRSIGYTYSKRSDNIFIKRHSVNFDKLLYLYRIMSQTIAKSENKLGYSMSRFWFKIRNFYFGMYVKGILNKSLFIFIKERKRFINEYGKDYSYKIDFISHIMWNLFLFSMVTACIYFILFNIKNALIRVKNE